MGSYVRPFSGAVGPVETISAEDYDDVERLRLYTDGFAKEGSFDALMVASADVLIVDARCPTTRRIFGQEPLRSVRHPLGHCWE